MLTDFQEYFALTLFKVLILVLLTTEFMVTLYTVCMMRAVIFTHDWWILRCILLIGNIFGIFLVINSIIHACKPMVKYFSTTNRASIASSLFHRPSRLQGVWADPSSSPSARRLLLENKFFFFFFFFYLLRPAERWASRRVGRTDPSSGPLACRLLVRPFCGPSRLDWDDLVG